MRRVYSVNMSPQDDRGRVHQSAFNSKYYKYDVVLIDYISTSNQNIVL